MKKQSTFLKKYKFCISDDGRKNRESYILSFYSKKEAIKYAEELQAIHPDKFIQIYLEIYTNLFDLLIGK